MKQTEKHPTPDATLAAMREKLGAHTSVDLGAMAVYWLTGVREIVGIGMTKKAAISDAAKWMFCTERDVEQMVMGGGLAIWYMTDALYRAVVECGGALSYGSLSDGTLCTDEEAEGAA